MPTRLVREGILSSDSVAKLSWGAECFYRRLMSVVDDFGRFDGRTIVLRAALYPVQVDKVKESEVAAWKRESAAAGLVTCYVVEGKEFVQIEKFGTPRAKTSKFPAPNLQTQTDANTCAQMQTDANGCEQTQTDESKRKQMHASVPYSYSDSNAHSDSSSNSDTPPPPRGEPRREKLDPRSIAIPEPLSSPEFIEAWGRWIDYRVGLNGSKLQFRSWEAQLATLARHGPQPSIAAIEDSIRNGYRGLFPDKHDIRHATGFRPKDLNFEGLREFAAGGGDDGPF